MADRKPICPKCESDNVRPTTGRVVYVNSIPAVEAHCDGCGHTWRTRAAVMVRDAALGKLKVVA